MLVCLNNCRGPWLQRQKLPEKQGLRCQFLITLTKQFFKETILKVIAAEGEKKASGALREASEIISESPAALQLRYLQVNKQYTRETAHKTFSFLLFIEQLKRKFIPYTYNFVCRFRTSTEFDDFKLVLMLTI